MWAARWGRHCLVAVRDRRRAVGDQAPMIARCPAAAAGAVALLARLLVVGVVRVVVHLLVRRSLSLRRVGFVEVRGRKLLILREKRRTESRH
jgi:hypothetical protein